MTRLLPFIAIAAGTLMVGCGSTSSRWIDETRHADTGILAGERIVVLLSRYSREGTEVKDLNSPEERFERCIRTGMQTVNNNLTFLPLAALRKLVSADTMGADSATSPDSLLRSFGEPVAATHLAEAQVRYVVVLEASYSTRDSKWSVDGSQGGVAAVKEWRQYSTLKATILDLKHARIAGSIESSLTGTEGAGGGVLIIIPFPIYYTSQTESKACANLGEALAQFISG